MTPASLLALCWPTSRLGEALQALAPYRGLGQGAQTVPADALLLPQSMQQGAHQDMASWVAWASAQIGMEAQAVTTHANEVDTLLRQARPAIWRIHTDEGEGVLVLLPAHKRWAGRAKASVLTPDNRVATVAVSTLRQAMLTRMEAPFAQGVQQLIDTAGIPPRRQARVRTAMLAERLAPYPVGTCWLMRLPPSASLWAQLRQARLPSRLSGMMALFTLLYALELTGWGLIGHASLNGQMDSGWLIAWALLMATLIPLRLLGHWLDATVSVDIGRLLKSRLLQGALNSPMDEVKKQGAGQVLAQVMESQALEALASQGGFGFLVGALELLFALGTLLAGAGGLTHAALLLAWLALSLVVVARFHSQLRRWTRTRLRMTHELVEHMVGHRTHLVQTQGQRHQARLDQALAGYVQDAQAMDAGLLPIMALLPRGWMLVGLLGLAPAFMQTPGTSATAPAGIAIGLGGLLLAYRALGGLTTSLASLSRALIAWQHTAPLWHAAQALPEASAFVATPIAEHAKQPGAHSLVQTTSGTSATSPWPSSVPTSALVPAPGPLPLTPPTLRITPLLDAAQLAFQHAPDASPVFKNVSLQVHAGERLLLEGPSGAGKSTLAAVLSGLRAPSQGLLLLQGWDRHTLGPQWRQRVSHAPQFHENHILSASLAFNLLMGRQWPPSEEDLAEAEALCQALGLGDLLERMPAGMLQMVGDTGWRLSHGEASRIYLARALLQDAPLTVLDESFAALDPNTLAQCMRCAWERSHTLLVVAHP
jgi:ATP-binding cassette subfamily B protein